MVLDLNLFIYLPSCLKLYAVVLQRMVISVLYVSIPGKLQARCLQEIKLQNISTPR